MSEAGFLNAIRADPTDTATRLIYADYLDEHGDPRSELLRLDARLAEPALEYAEFEEVRRRLHQLRAVLCPQHKKWLAAMDAPDRFAMLLTNEHCDERRRLGHVGQPFRFLAAPAWSRFKPHLQPLIYAIRIQQKQLYVVGRLRLTEVTSRDAYLQNYAEDAPLLSSFERTVMVGDQGTPFRPDCVVPLDMLQRFRYLVGERDYPLKHVKDGELTHPVHLTGITRLTKATGQDLDFLLTGPRTRRCP